MLQSVCWLTAAAPIHKTGSRIRSYPATVLSTPSVNLSVSSSVPKAAAYNLSSAYIDVRSYRFDILLAFAVFKPCETQLANMRGHVIDGRSCAAGR